MITLQDIQDEINRLDALNAQIEVLNAGLNVAKVRLLAQLADFQAALDSLKGVTAPAQTPPIVN